MAAPRRPSIGAASEGARARAGGVRRPRPGPAAAAAFDHRQQRVDPSGSGSGQRVVTGYVIDASIVVKWLVAEEWSDQSSRLLAAGATLIAPELVFAEASNALWAMHRRGDLTRDDLAEAVDVLKAAPVDVPVSMPSACRSAVRLAVDLAIPPTTATTWRSQCRSITPSSQQTRSSRPGAGASVPVRPHRARGAGVADAQRRRPARVLGHRPQPAPRVPRT